MNIVTMASRKGGAGKSTLTAHLAAFSQQAGHRCVVIDADPQGSLTLWHSLRPDGKPPLRSAARGIDRALATAMVEGYGWAFIDTAASMWVVAQEAIRAATFVLIPARPGFFDLNAVRETVATARERNKPYAVVLNAAPVKREDKEAPAVAQSRAFFDRLGIPVWSGQISQRAGYVLTLAAGASVCEVAPESLGHLRNCAAVVGGRTLRCGDQRSAPAQSRPTRSSCIIPPAAQSAAAFGRDDGYQSLSESGIEPFGLRLGKPPQCRRHVVQTIRMVLLDEPLVGLFDLLDRGGSGQTEDGIPGSACAGLVVSVVPDGASASASAISI